MIPNTPYLNCDGCRGSTGSLGCPTHWQPFSVSHALTIIAHVHEWRLAGRLDDGTALLVCPHHEPPETRVTHVASEEPS